MARPQIPNNGVWSLRYYWSIFFLFFLKIPPPPHRTPTLRIVAILVALFPPDRVGSLSAKGPVLRALWLVRAILFQVGPLCLPRLNPLFRPAHESEQLHCGLSLCYNVQMTALTEYDLKSQAALKARELRLERELLNTPVAMAQKIHCALIKDLQLNAPWLIPFITRR